MHTAKVFRHGGSQAVRLPAEFRFDVGEVFVWRDESTGHIVLSARPASWEAFLERRDRMLAEDPSDIAGFEVERREPPPEADRDPFDGWRD